MAGILMVARAAMRRQAGTLVAIALVIGIAGAAVLVAAAGARRTATSLDRFRADTLASDVELDISSATPAEIARLRADPAVERVGRLRQVMLASPDADEHGEYLPTASALDASFGRAIDRARVIEGRRADPTRVHELEISEVFASRSGLGIGDALELGSYSPAQIELGAAGEQVGVPAGPRVRFRIVGIVRRPLDLGIAGASGGVLLLTPAFHERYQDDIGGFVDALLRVRARDGDAGVPGVVRAARAIFEDRLFGVSGVSDETQGVSDAIDVLAVALWIFAAVAALAGATTIGIILVRQLGAVERDQATLAAMGLTSRQRALAAVMVTAPTALGGAVLAVALAAALSPRFPIGIARKAEVHPGIHLDAVVLAFGALAIVGFTLLVSAVAAWRAARATSPARDARDPVRPSVAARLAAGTGAGPALTTGLRLALEPGRRSTAVPVRSALFGAALATVGITAVLVFGASLDHLAATPRLYGWGWDATITPNQPLTRCDEAATVTDDPDLAAVATLCLEGLEVGRRPVTGWFLHSLRGTVEPTIVTGRAPATADEVALGKATLDATGTRVGDVVRVRGETTTKPFRVVGQVVLPHLSDEDTDPIDEGALFAGAAIEDLFEPIAAPNMYVVARFADDVDAGTRRFESGAANAPTIPADIERLRQVDDLPVYLAVLLAFLATASVAHAVAVAVRRRRHDLAVLRAMGFLRRDVRTTIAYQATILALVALVIGVPLGVVVARLVWSAVAGGIGVATVIAVPWLALAGVALGALVVVNVIGALGAGAALRDRPATVLAVE